ncbi:MAG TPA: septum formation initiator family protein [Gemmatimonadota bacterium]|nr:septum formation initiator family protein [Gemmatimonadota bacterium]
MGERARRWVRRAVLAGVWGVAVYYLAFGGEYSWSDLHGLEGERDAAAARLDSLSAAADSVGKRADSLRSDPFAIERTARERYGFLKDGEHLYRFVDAGKGADPVDRARGPG